MSSTAKKGGSATFLEGLYKVIMRRNSVYITFIIAGAFLGERVVDSGVRKLWDMNNVGKRYEDIPVLGQRQSEEERTMGLSWTHVPLSAVFQVVDSGVRKLWDMNNVGKRYEDIPVLGQRQSEEEGSMGLSWSHVPLSAMFQGT